MSPIEIPKYNDNELRKTLSDDYKNRKMWNSRDFIFAQLIAWTSLLTSTAVTIWTAIGVRPDQNWKTCAAILTAIPGLMIAVESGFHFSLRSKMNGTATYEIMKFQLMLDKGQDPMEVATQYVEYMKQFNNDFPGGAAVPKAS